ncbi:MAG TPA: hypothetical protein PLA71_00440 [Saccharofermentans sp.]|nr:hypothetical protein [Saccharofermentans sp.]
MKKLAMLVSLIGMLLFSGCATVVEKVNTEDNREKLIELVDKLVAEGRLGAKNAEDLKKAIQKLDKAEATEE